ncbi:hypothetical protein [Brevibacterium sp. UBA7493]|uniref:hypothetical protein n=1 Tax=Brevibacterium sp. UBA7493 TaxID=1946121 RepID=UPI00257A8788|nr:hypothetical protein [Brevibacterium sp. UBA7493]
MGAKVVIISGAAVTTAGLLFLQGLAVDSSYTAVLFPALILVGFGMGTVFTAAIATATTGVDLADVGVASATVNMVQQIGGSIGIALFIGLYASAVARRIAATGAGAAEATVHGYYFPPCGETPNTTRSATSWTRSWGLRLFHWPQATSGSWLSDFRLFPHGQNRPHQPVRTKALKMNAGLDGGLRVRIGTVPFLLDIPAALCRPGRCRGT